MAPLASDTVQSGNVRGMKGRRECSGKINTHTHTRNNTIIILGTGLGTNLGKTLMCQLTAPDDLPKPAGEEHTVAHTHIHTHAHAYLCKDMHAYTKSVEERGNLVYTDKINSSASSVLLNQSPSFSFVALSIYFFSFDGVVMVVRACLCCRAELSS